MLVKAVALFLVAMLALAIFGRLRVPGRRLPPKADKAVQGRTTPVICIRCGTPIPGPGNCACGARRPGDKG